MTIYIVTENRELYFKYIELNVENKEDAGFDIIAPEDFVFTKQDKIDFEVKVLFFENDEFISYDLMSKSSSFNKKLMLYNSVGLVDSGYRGNLIGLFFPDFQDHSECKENEQCRSIHRNPKVSKFEKVLQVVHPERRKLKIKIIFASTTNPDFIELTNLLNQNTSNRGSKMWWS